MKLSKILLWSSTVLLTTSLVFYQIVEGLLLENETIGQPFALFTNLSISLIFLFIFKEKLVNFNWITEAVFYTFILIALQGLVFEFIFEDEVVNVIILNNYFSLIIFVVNFIVFRKLSKT